MSQPHTPIRVLIVDDHPMMRNGLKSFLAATPSLECAGEAGSGEKAIELCEQLHPDVILMDLSMPGMGGVAAIRFIHKRFPSTRIIALTSFSDPGLVQEAVAAGAIGYLLKNVPAAVLGEAVQTAAAGRPVLGPEAVDALMQIAANPRPIGSDLTDREHEVLNLLVKGRTNFEIAKFLYISEATVRFHVGNILSKLEVGNRTEAVQVALQYKLVS
jgi:NarL family two-component system response regulator LiaR